MALSAREKDILLAQAWAALGEACGVPAGPYATHQDIPAGLQAPGASFVTLYAGGGLRGCVGSVEARRPLVEDVRENAVAAGFSDFRFSPLRKAELPAISLEISVLTPLESRGTLQGDQLLATLRPGLDGVLLRDGQMRGLFLPKVWQKLPEPEAFLDHLCQKMGLPPAHWRSNSLEVYIFQTEDFGRGN